MARNFQLRKLAHHIRRKQIQSWPNERPEFAMPSDPCLDNFYWKGGYHAFQGTRNVPVGVWKDTCLGYRAYDR